MFESIDSVAQKRSANCVRSPNAVSPLLRGTSRDTITCTPTTAHTTAVHQPCRFPEIKLTLRVYVQGGECAYYRSNRASDVTRVGFIQLRPRSAEQTGRRRDTSCTAAPELSEMYRAPANHPERLPETVDHTAFVRFVELG